jgi:acyl-coenzyme A synthetase/AMP-(fatty) acid ligase/acyl carrier protein
MKATISGRLVNIAPERGLADYLCKLAADEGTSDLVAIKHNDKTITIRALNSTSNQMARMLLARGIKRGDYVALYMPRSIDLIVSVFAILKIGAVCVLASEDTIMNQRLQQVVINTNIKLFITDTVNSKRALLQSGVQHVLLYDSERFPSIRSDLKVSISINESAFVVFTSGSTGTPKGVLLSHASILNDALPGIAEPALSRADALLMSSPVDSARITGEIFYPLFYGAKIVILDESQTSNIRHIVQTIIDNQITTLFMIPSMLKEMLKNGNFKNCTSLRYLQSLGEQLSSVTQKTLYEICNTTLVNVYGQSEAGCCSINYCLAQDDLLLSVKSGRPVPNRSIHIVNDKDELMNVNEVGTVCIGGVGLALKYICNDLTTDAQLPMVSLNGTIAFKTNDIGYINTEGVLILLGRSDQIIKVLGNRVSLPEVENIIIKTDLVMDAIVRNVDLPNGRQQLIALVVDGYHKKVSTREWRSILDGKMQSYMIPKEFIYFDSIPRSASGKVDETEAKKIMLSARGSKPYTVFDVYVQIFEFVVETLEVKDDSVSSHDVLPELGASSIDISAILVQIMDEYDCELGFEDAYNLSLRGIAEKVFGLIEFAERE